MIRLIFIICILYGSIVEAQFSYDDTWKEYITVINEEKINTELTEFSPTYWNEYIVYVGSRSRQKLFDKKHNEPYYDLYLAGKNKNGILDRTAAFSKILNSPYHEGPMSFSKDGSKIFFTRVEYSNGDLNMNAEKVVQNKIYESQYSAGEWQEGSLSILNMEEAASCHPSLSEDGRFIIFSSDRAGGFGKMDLYIAYHVNGQWEEPKNLGPEINTPENEIFPTIHDNNYLLYSSNYNTNNGDLDIFKIKLNTGNPTEAIRLPEPINSNYDDFGIAINSLGLTGYLSSNRPSGKGKDDIYKFNSEKSILSYKDEAYNKVKIIVSDQFGTEMLKDITIKLCPVPEDQILSFDDSVFDIQGQDIKTMVTDENGITYLQLYDGYNLISIESEGKEKWQKIISSLKTEEQITVKLRNEIKPKRDTIIQYIEKEVPIKINNVEVKEGATLIFNNIYYDYNSDAIKKGAAYELDELAVIMVNNTNLRIQLSAHTDSRGEASYNQALSERRASSAKKYLITKGVQAQQITTVGHGESQLRNHCKDGVNCSEAEHIYNRRTEVKVLQTR
jgi:outer membrane protein OmpA-like peptidoglycan-associated protein